VIVRRLRKVSAPVEIYRESDMITRTIRDNFKSDISRIVVDDPVAFQHAAEFMQVVMPRYADRIHQHDNSEPLFHSYRLDEEIAKLNQKRLELPRGGSIIIEQTEALVAIDVNSGSFRAENDAENTAYQMNLIAAKEIARQLRLRDLGGVIINDFIDMREERHRRHVEKTLNDALARDKARTKVLRISQFGLIEMTRQRMQQSLKKRIYNDCSHCKGTGHVKTNETLAIDAMRLLHLAAHKAMAGNPPISSVSLTVCADAASHLLNRKRRDIAALEDQAKMEISISGAVGVSPDHLEVKCLDSNGNEVKLLSAGPPPKLFSKSKRFD
jgi:ribonuclease E